MLKPSQIIAALGAAPHGLTRDALIDVLVRQTGDTSAGARRALLNEARPMLNDLTIVGEVTFTSRRGGRWHSASSGE